MIGYNMLSNIFFWFNKIWTEFFILQDLKLSHLDKWQDFLSQNCGKKTFGFEIVPLFLSICSSSGLHIRSVLNTNLISCKTLLNRKKDDARFYVFFFFSCPRFVYYSRRCSSDSSPPYLEFLIFSFLLFAPLAPFIWSQDYNSLQLSEDNDDVGVWLPVATIMRFLLCLHFVPERVHLMSKKFFKISFWGCVVVVTATVSECGLYLWKMTTRWKCGVVSPKVRYVTGMNQIKFYPPVSHLMTRIDQLSSRAHVLRSLNSPDHGGPRRGDTEE